MYEKYCPIKTNYKNIFEESDEEITAYNTLPDDTKIEEGSIKVKGKFKTIDKKGTKDLEITICHETLSRSKNKEWIVFVNGFSSSIALWEYQKAFFLKNGYNLLCFDQIGQGKSTKPEGIIYDVPFQSECLKKLVDKLKLKDFIIFGLSAGGMISLEFCSKYQDMAKSLVLITTGYKCQGKLRVLLELFAKILTLDMADEDKMKLFYRALVPNIFSSSFMESYEDFMQDLMAQNITRNTVPGLLGAVLGLMDFDQEENLSKITIPTLIIAGLQDAIFPISDSSFMNNNMPNSQRVLFIGENASHTLLIEMFQDLNEAILYEISNIDKFVGSKLTNIIENTYIGEMAPAVGRFFLNF